MNAVLIAVLVMVILSLCRLNVVLSLFIGALAGGLVSGLGIDKTIVTFTGGIVDGSEVALSYALLGGFAAILSYSGITDYFVEKIINMLKKDNTVKTRTVTKVTILVSLIIISCMSQNILPVHIAFIPIIIPPLLSLFNELKIDRRLIAVILTFGLNFPYVLMPYGFGYIFHGIIKKGFDKANHPIEMNQILPAMIIPSLGFIIGLIIAFIIFRKPREYKMIQFKEEVTRKVLKPYVVMVSIVAIVATFLVQLTTESMIFGALAGIMVFFLSFAFEWKTLDEELVSGIKIMAYIGVVMLTANGFASVMSETGDVERLVVDMVNFTSGSKVLTIIFMLIVGLIVTLGIGSSFATIPIIAALFIPLGESIGLSTAAIIAVIGTAGALGDAGSPASDSTLGPTAGLNMDGQHNHIWDTCVPTFLLFNIPLIICGFIAAMIL
ncbi:Na+/H+ antiporter family protein [Macrococcoides caseolyticum]|uniref:Na+/H+ antiporter family protein n=1 Tax=Macrococcoides caseolyticum TaxID=69966 RepID=UPI000C34950C|nr:Na+/H+ antiporter NhaC family protein [Macrococcus caseolyticus]PKD98173.1 sodium:proton antiporter [Macrococcus caseolyticus]PKE07769.1 sodium:proton antiporter [Macrococcus caseolyticus]PKE17721.1 sodium:proton antiporter [Macrococcus caseolyticus]PKE24214.1 sodium:proton antiporter [Macrococcus caseolyticus]PKE50002.1 sodium:proton antiporter [Macrococcus caseolyticus]